MSGALSGRETTGTRLSKIQATYRSKSRAAWLAATTAATTAVVLALWVTPWVPIGMTQDDFSHKVWVTLVLAAGSALLGFLAFFTREPASTEGDVAEVWHGLLGKGVLLRNHRQFKYRLARECQRAQRDWRFSLSLILVQVSTEESGSHLSSRDALDQVARTLTITVRSSDVIGIAMGIAGSDEIGVLAIGANTEAREAICARLEQALAAALTEWTGAKASGKAPVVSLGASTFGSEDDSEALVAAARQALRPLAIHAPQAA